tara:strand:- start:1973 stop:2224 length:252 start_codon:yes stop_codon:yes gene_type:complete
MRYPSFNLLGLLFVLAGIIRVCEILSIDFFQIKSADFLTVLGAIFLAYICWTISRLLPLFVNFLNLQEKVCRRAITNYFDTEE